MSQRGTRRRVSSSRRAPALPHAHTTADGTSPCRHAPRQPPPRRCSGSVRAREACVATSRRGIRHRIDHRSASNRIRHRIDPPSTQGVMSACALVALVAWRQGRHRSLHPIRKFSGLMSLQCPPPPHTQTHARTSVPATRTHLTAAYLDPRLHPPHPAGPAQHTHAPRCATPTNTHRALPCPASHRTYPGPLTRPTHQRLPSRPAHATQRHARPSRSTRLSPGSVPLLPPNKPWVPTSAGPQDHSASRAQPRHTRRLRAPPLPAAG